MKTKPLYDHDCDRCRFVGTYNGRDLYVCAFDGAIDAVLLRQSSKGGDYESALIDNTRVLIPSIVNAIQSKGITKC
jgi:hypothetical protein